MTTFKNNNFSLCRYLPPDPDESKQTRRDKKQDFSKEQVPSFLSVLRVAKLLLGTIAKM